MIRYTYILLFISIVLIMINLIQLSSEYEKHSTESELYDDYSLDRTIDVTDREDKNQVNKDNASESYESSQEGNLYIMSSIAILFQIIPVHDF